MVNVFAVLEGVEEIEEKIFFLFEVMSSLLLNCFHMLHVYPDALSFQVSEDLSQRKPVFLVEGPHVFGLTCMLDIELLIE